MAQPPKKRSRKNVKKPPVAPQEPQAVLEFRAALGRDEVMWEIGSMDQMRYFADIADVVNAVSLDQRFAEQHSPPENVVVVAFHEQRNGEVGSVQQTFPGLFSTLRTLTVERTEISEVRAVLTERAFLWYLTVRAGEMISDAQLALRGGGPLVK